MMYKSQIDFQQFAVKQIYSNSKSYIILKS